MITGKSIVKRSVYKPKLHWLCERYGIDASLLSNLQILLDQSRHDSEGTSGRWVDISGNGNDFVQGTAGSQPALYSAYRDFDGNDFLPHEEIDSEQGALSYTTEGADSTFTDASQVFTTYAGSGTATYRIVVHNDDATISYGYLGAAVSATEIKVYSDISLTTTGWKGTAIAGKTPSTYEIYKVIGSDNLTGSQTHILVLKPDDGAPGTNNYLITRWSDTAGSKIFRLYLGLDGILYLYRSQDGTNEEVVNSSAAYLSDGAQASFVCAAITLDTTSGTGVVYKNGAAVATTETITAGANLDGYLPITIGRYTAAGYLDGQIALYMCFNTALSAAHALDIHNSDAVQAAIR